MTNKMIKDNNKNLELLKDDLKDLNKEIKNQQKIFENNLSKKETLEDICNTIINNIKNSNLTNSINNDYYIEITLEDIKNNNKNLYINKVFEAFNFINNYNNTNYLNYIRMIIEEAYSDFYTYLNNNKVYNNNNLINNFFIGISSKFFSHINCKTSEKAVDLLLKFILKINIITEIIHGVIHFLEHEYKDRKNEINEKLAEIEKKLESLQHQKDELITLKNNITEKLNILSNNKKTPFCEKTICQKRLNRKDLILNNISSTVHFSTECIKKSNSNSHEKTKVNTCTNNAFNKSNNNDDIKQRKILYRNMIKFFNKNNKNGETSVHHSNRISISKIYLKGKSGQSSNEKNRKKKQIINGCKNINLNYKKIDWTQKKENLNKNIVANGINSDTRERERNNFYFNIKELSNLHHYTENNINNNEIKVNQLNNKYSFDKNIDNGKSMHNCDKEKTNETERILEIDTYKSKNINYINNINNININNIDNTVINEHLKPIYKNKKYKSPKTFSLYDISIEKQSISIKKDKNLLSKYLSKNNNYDKNKCEQKTNKKSKNLVHRMKNKNKVLNDELISDKKNKNNTFEKSERKISITQNNFIKNNIDESFCFYRLLENDSKLFNPLNNELNINKLGYCEGFISIDNCSDCIIIASKKNNYTINYENTVKYQMDNNMNTNNENNIIIHLKDIKKVYLNNIMKNIIKIHNIFLKHNFYNNQGNDNDISKKRFSNINKLLNIREIMYIKDMEQSEKIKAGLCNFFSFVLECNNNQKIECILINFYQFNAWLEYLENTAQNNIKSKKDLVNGNSSFTQNGNNVIRSKELCPKIENDRINKNLIKTKKIQK